MTDHNRITDMNTEYNHSRVSDIMIIDLVRASKSNEIKMDAIISTVSELKRASDDLKDRVTRMESSQETLQKSIEQTKEYVAAHAVEEREILDAQFEKLKTLHADIDHVKRGFPKNVDGERDPRSHADDHELENMKNKNYKQLIEDVKRWAAIGILGAVTAGTFYLMVSGSKVELKKVVYEQDTTKTNAK